MRYFTAALPDSFKIEIFYDRDAKNSMFMTVMFFFSKHCLYAKQLTRFKMQF